jgi:hypothetical protein
MVWPCHSQVVMCVMSHLLFGPHTLALKTCMLSFQHICRLMSIGVVFIEWHIIYYVQLLNLLKHIWSRPTHLSVCCLLTGCCGPSCHGCWPPCTPQQMSTVHDPTLFTSTDDVHLSIHELWLHCVAICMCMQCNDIIILWCVYATACTAACVDVYMYKCVLRML